MTPMDILNYGFWTYTVAFLVGLLVHFFIKQQYESLSAGFAHSIAAVSSAVILIIYFSVADLSNISSLKDFAESAIYVMAGIIWGIGALVCAGILMFVTKLVRVN